MRVFCIGLPKSANGIRFIHSSQFGASEKLPYRKLEICVANRIHEQAALSGKQQIARLRNANPSMRLDLSESHLKGLNLSGVDFSDADLRNADLTNCILCGAILNRANLTSANLEGADLSHAILKDVVLDSAKLGGSTLTKATFRDASIKGARLNHALLLGADLTNANLAGSHLADVDFSGAVFKYTNFSNCDLSGAIFCKSDLPADTFNTAILATCNTSRMRFSSINMSGLDLSNLILDGVNFDNVNLTKTDLRNGQFPGGTFNVAIFSGAHLKGASFSQANLENIDLSNLDLTGVSFWQTTLNHASLLGATIDSTTVFGGNKCFCLKVDQYTAEYMRDSLNHGQRMDLRIEDDLAKLRSEFSGIWAAIHMLGILVFFLPYIWFIVARFASSESIVAADSTLLQIEEWANSESVNEELRMTDKFRNSVADKIGRTARDWRTEFQLSRPREISVLNALCRYVWNGGVRWKEGYFLNSWYVTNFLVISAYNLVRLFLLWKTKKLETEQAVTGLPVKFSLGSSASLWRRTYNLNRAGYWLTLVLILINTGILLMRSVRI